MTNVHLPPQVSLDDLLAVPVPIAWHEAVAVVRVVAQLVLLDPHAQPDTAHTWLGHDGTLWLERPGNHQGAVRVGDIPPMEALVWPPAAEELEGVTAVEVRQDGSLTAVRETPGDLVAALCALLRALLPDSAPDSLRALADPMRIDVDTAEPEVFIAALSVFARPDDDRELRALARRTVDLLESRARANALRELTERARVPPPPAPVPEPPMVKAATPLRAVVVGAAVLASLAAAGVWRAVVGGGPPSDPVSAAVAVAPAVPQAALERTSAARVSRRSAAADGRGDRRARRASAAPPTPIEAAPASVEEPSVAGGRATAPLASDTAPDIVADSPVAARALGQAVDQSVPVDRVYDSNDPDVVPPKILRAQMPEHPTDGLPAEPLGVLELRIDQAGVVQQARLVPDSRRLQDRLMVSAAKTWRFAAARRDGRPVRYRLRMPITR